jgi:hypothetical protein
VTILRAEAFKLEVLSLPCLVLYCLALNSVILLLLFSSLLLSLVRREDNSICNFCFAYLNSAMLPRFTILHSLSSRRQHLRTGLILILQLKRLLLILMHIDGRGRGQVRARGWKRERACTPKTSKKVHSFQFL